VKEETPAKVAKSIAPLTKSGSLVIRDQPDQDAAISPRRGGGTATKLAKGTTLEPHYSRSLDLCLL